MYCIRLPALAENIILVKQYLQCRMNLHKNDCQNQNIDKKDKIALVLDKEYHYTKRNMSEMIYININITMNMRSDKLQSKD